MKKLYALLGILSSGISCLHAQITITRSDFGMIGDVLYYANDTTLTNLSVGPSGVNQTWNFSTSVRADYYDTSSFVDPLTLDGAPAEANLAIDEGADSEPAFFNIDNTRVKTILALGDFGMDNQQLTITNFPLNYGDIIKDSAYTKVQGTPDDFGFSGLPYDSLRITVDIHTTSTADGWGSITTPGGTHSALRVRNVTDVDVTIEGKLPIIGWSPVPVNPDRQQILYAWYGNGKKFSLAEANLDTNGVVTSFRYQVDSIPKKPTTGIAALSTNNKTITTYPNPANEKLFVHTPYTQGLLEIKTVTGQSVLTQPLLNNTTNIDIQNIPNGIYFMHVRNSEGSIEKSKIVIQH